MIAQCFSAPLADFDEPEPGSQLFVGGSHCSAVSLCHALRHLGDRARRLGLPFHAWRRVCRTTRPIDRPLLTLHHYRKRVFRIHHLITILILLKILTLLFEAVWIASLGVDKLFLSLICKFYLLDRIPLQEDYGSPWWVGYRLLYLFRVRSIIFAHTEH